MNFLINKFLINPAFWILIFALIGIAYSFKKGIGGKIFSFALFLLILGLFDPLSYLVVERIEQKHAVLSFLPWGETPPILVLGSGGIPDDRLMPSQQLTAHSMARCLEGYRIWKKLPESKLVLSSAGREGFISQAEIYASAVKEWGVPDSAIIVVTTPTNTIEEAKDFREMFPEENGVILVTSALHMGRAIKIFKAVGLEPIPAPTEFRVKRHPGGPENQWVPNIESLILWEKVAHEVLGRIYIRLFGI